MSESYSVRAILSATDKSFSSTLKGASSVVETLASKIKSGFAFGVLTGMGQQAFSALTSGAQDLVSEINSASKSWQTFEGNMKVLGKSDKYIADARSELQKYAQQTVYSSSDMASTYAQLEAVGTKSTMQLVKGFGGLAAASENPAQAMKSLSQQATQMAAKPKVAWEDFKIMMEQTPAGMSEVAKAMGKTTSQLISDVQSGKVKTEDFFSAIIKAGEGFQDMATKAKTVDQAMDGLKETAGNKLLPAFTVLSDVAIGVVDKIAGALESIDGDALAAKVSAGVETATQFLNVLRDSFAGVGKEVGEALKAVGDALGITNAEFSKQDALKSFGDRMSNLAGKIKQVSNFIEEHADTIGKVLPWIVKLAVAYKGFKAVNSIIPGMSAFSGAIKSLAGKGISSIASKLFGVSESQEQVGKSSSKSSKKMLTAAKSYALMGVAVLAISVGFALLAQSAIALANAGPLAIGVMAGLVVAVAALSLGMMAMLNSMKVAPAKMQAASVALLALGAAVLLVAVGFAILVQSAISLANAGGLAIGVAVGMVAAIALLAAGAAALGPALTAGAGGFIAFGAAIVLVGVGALLAAAALVVVASVLPTVTAYGSEGAAAITELGLAMMVFAAGAALAGVAAIVLAAGLVIAAVGIVAAAAAVALLGAAMLILAASTLVAGVAMSLIALALPTIAEYGTSGALALAALGVAMTAFAAGAVLAGAAILVLAAGFLAAAIGVTALGVGVIVLAAGVVLLAAGALLAVTALMLLSVVLPTIAEYGTSGALAIAALGAGMLVFAAGAAVAGAACILLGAGLTVVAAGLVLVAASTLLTAAAVLALSVSAIALGASLLLVTASLTTTAAMMLLAAASGLALSASFIALLAVSAGLAAIMLATTAALAALAVATAACTVTVAAFAVAVTASAAGVLVMAAALLGVSSQMKVIASSAKKAEKSLDSMQDSVSVVESGLDALGSKAKQAMKSLGDAFNDAADDAKKAGKEAGTGFTQGMQTGLAKAPIIAVQMVTVTNAQLSAGRAGAYAAGAYISQGFAQGMLSCLATIRSAAAQMAAAADAAVRAKAKIHSPSKVADKLGGYWGIGLAGGIEDKAKAVWKAAEKLVSIPNMAIPNLALAYDGGLSADYDYSQKAEYNITVVSEMDGREVARSTATYMQDELDKQQTRDSRKYGIR